MFTLRVYTQLTRTSTPSPHTLFRCDGNYESARFLNTYRDPVRFSRLSSGEIRPFSLSLSFRTWGSAVLGGARRHNNWYLCNFVLGLLAGGPPVSAGRVVILSTVEGVWFLPEAVPRICLRTIFMSAQPGLDDYDELSARKKISLDVDDKLSPTDNVYYTFGILSSYIR